MESKTGSSTQWTGVQAYTLAVVCLLLGMAGGWLIRGSQAAVPQAMEAAGATAGAGRHGRSAEWHGWRRAGNERATDAGTDEEDGGRASGSGDREAEVGSE